MLTDDELRRMLWVLMMGGLHTVRSVLAFGIIRLATDREARRQMVTDPAVVPHLVEELLRLCAPVSPARTVTKSVRVGTVSMDEGDRVLVALPAACRDPAEFPDPEALVADRVPNRHLAFNAGPHRCLGSTLARIELAVALREFHARIPDYEVDPGADPLVYGGQIIGINDLRIRFPAPVR
jgi:cytochrome P450